MHSPSSSCQTCCNGDCTGRTGSGCSARRIRSLHSLDLAKRLARQLQLRYLHCRALGTCGARRHAPALGNPHHWKQEKGLDTTQDARGCHASWPNPLHPSRRPQARAHGSCSERQQQQLQSMEQGTCLAWNYAPLPETLPQLMRRSNHGTILGVDGCRCSWPKSLPASRHLPAQHPGNCCCPLLQAWLPLLLLRLQW